MLLAIDTSTRYAGVALAHEGRVLSCRCWHSTVNHTTELMPAVAQTLEARSLAVRDLEGIAVALGPGGFSSLRVGLSAAKGLAKAAGLPLAGVVTLDLEAFPYMALGLPVCAWLDAGRGEVAAACFGPGGQRCQADTIGTPEALLEALPASATQPTLFCGEGVMPWAGLIKDRLGPGALVVAQSSPAVRLSSLVELGGQRLAAGQVSELAALQPYYLRMPTLGSPKRRDWTPQRSQA
ncbi:MAG: tRNA (adenosine(37)-N6)-threonylcarbamoyltransferase complex dimerization subunit type 1 TsaB [Dehalococcoidia bacterium]|nr:tRNA (adenosine(37)-N6)-threonylcarbamoyltransferase complex dimerization subunit type 1 TsaB [Dehalococcoidia bacterium]MSQ16091.1 tRNA (adenosine(37)-N6)-threonylcarbamoyltransferase complex dimerization subunit type 1 TsaB [Dehalococcoidia bacterium]